MQPDSTQEIDAFRLSILDYLMEVRNRDRISALDALKHIMAPAVVFSHTDTVEVAEPRVVTEYIKRIYELHLMSSRETCIPQLGNDFKLGTCTHLVELELHFGDEYVDERTGVLEVVGEVMVNHFLLVIEITQERRQIIAWHEAEK